MIPKLTSYVHPLWVSCFTLDAHVATHMFQECIVNELLLGGDKASKKRSVVLTTNALQYLNSPYVDTIIVVKDGRIAEEGTYEQLSQGGSLFSIFLSTDTRYDEEQEEKTVSTDMPHVRSAASLSALADVDEPEVSSILIPKDKAPHSPTCTKKKPFGAEKGLNNGKGIVEGTTQKPSTGAALMTDEEREIGHVSWDIYLSWAKAAGGVHVFIAIITAFSCVEGVNVLSKWW